MAIYQLFEEEKKEGFTETFEPKDLGRKKQKKSSVLFSSLVTRLCFFLLLIADCAWLIYNTLMCLLFFMGWMLTCGKSMSMKKFLKKFSLHFRRSLACKLALFVGLLSPPFGVMIACTYFLMYDKTGMEEVVPAALQAQFKDIFHTER